MSNAIESIYQSIQARPRPEDVAQLIQELIMEELPTITNSEVKGQLKKLHKALEPAARNSLKRGANSYSSMSKDFARVVGADKMVATTAKIFEIPDPPSAVECLIVEKVEDFLARISAALGVDPAHVDFKLNRLNREQRREAGIEMKKRPYNHRFRAIRRLKFKLLKMIKNAKKYQATRIAKSAGATKISLEELGKDLHTAYFVAYLAARMSLRSAFTNDSQVRAHDVISEALYQNAKKSTTTNWWAISLVHSQKEVLAKLTDEEKGMLLGTWTETLSKLGYESGIRGFVCSPHEVKALKRAMADAFYLVPGVRSAGSNVDDQKRVGTPSQAVNDGANLIVIGRQIRDSNAPQIEAQSIAEEIRVGTAP